MMLRKVTVPRSIALFVVMTTWCGAQEVPGTGGDSCGYDGQFQQLESGMANLLLQLNNIKVTMDITAAASTMKCQDGWVVYSDYCLYFNFMYQTFEQAQDYCERLGARLVEPDNEGLHMFVSGYLNQFQATPWWIGISDSFNEGSWKLVSSNKYPLYQGWSYGQPDKNKPWNNCAAYYPKPYLWMTSDCGAKYKSICEIQASTDASGTTVRPDMPQLP